MTSPRTTTAKVKLAVRSLEKYDSRIPAERRLKPYRRRNIVQETGRELDCEEVSL